MERGGARARDRAARLDHARARRTSWCVRMADALRPGEIYDGVLITCDAPIKQYILHLNQNLGKDTFVVADLDERNVLVKPERVEEIQRLVEELQASNSFERPPGHGEGEKEEQLAKKARKKKDSAA